MMNKSQKLPPITQIVRNKPSVLLSDELNKKLFKALAPKWVSLLTSKIQLWSKANNQIQWTIQYKNILCFIVDTNKDVTVIRVYDPKVENILFELNVWQEFEFKSRNSLFHTISTSNGSVGLKFSYNLESSDFKTLVLEKKLNRLEVLYDNRTTHLLESKDEVDSSRPLYKRAHPLVKPLLRMNDNNKVGTENKMKNNLSKSMTSRNLKSKMDYFIDKSTQTTNVSLDIIHINLLDKAINSLHKGINYIDSCFDQLLNENKVIESMNTNNCMDYTMDKQKMKSNLDIINECNEDYSILLKRCPIDISLTTNLQKKRHQTTQTTQTTPLMTYPSEPELKVFKTQTETQSDVINELLDYYKEKIYLNSNIEDNNINGHTKKNIRKIIDYFEKLNQTVVQRICQEMQQNMLRISEEKSKVMTKDNEPQYTSSLSNNQLKETVEEVIFEEFVPKSMPKIAEDMAINKNIKDIHLTKTEDLLKSSETLVTTVTSLPDSQLSKYEEFDDSNNETLTLSDSDLEKIEENYSNKSDNLSILMSSLISESVFNLLFDPIYSALNRSDTVYKIRELHRHIYEELISVIQMPVCPVLDKCLSSDKS